MSKKKSKKLRHSKQKAAKAKARKKSPPKQIEKPIIHAYTAEESISQSKRKKYLSLGLLGAMSTGVVALVAWLVSLAL